MAGKNLMARMRERRGIAVLLTSLMMLILMPIVGLSIDAGYAFLVKTRMSAAMDSAALAAGRGLNLSQTVSQAQAQATSQAVAFFNANFPVGYLNTDTVARTLTPTFTLQTDSNGNPTGVLTISVAGSVQMPTYFMRWLGFNSLTVTAIGTATRRNLVMELVLDKSYSMGTRNTGVGTIPTGITANSSSCEAMVYSSIQFLTYFSPYDNVGVVSFESYAFNDYPPSTNFKRTGSQGAASAIANIQCGGSTNTAAALELAFLQIQAKNQPLAQNVIVLFTDGVPNGASALYPIRTQVDDRLSPASAASNPPNTPTGNRGNCLNNNGQTLCLSMPACTTTPGTLRAVLSQSAGFNVESGNRNYYDHIFATDPAAVLPPSPCPSGGGTDVTSQVIAYIPDQDAFGNNMSGPYDPPSWIYQVNQHCAPNGTVITPGNTACKNLGDVWSHYPNLPVSGQFPPSNRFPTSNVPYGGKLRPDLTNAIGIASMNSAVNEAARIRANTVYNITIHTIYLQGNSGDPVDRAFLQIVANEDTIMPIIYDPTAPSYHNPYYQSNQQQGLWLATTSTLDLTRLFSLVASSLLRISQ